MVENLKKSTMTLLNLLPSVLQGIFKHWISLVDIVYFDLAICSRQERRLFASLLSHHPVTTFEINVSVEASLKAIRWLLIRKFNLQLNCGPKMKIVSTLDQLINLDEFNEFIHFQNRTSSLHVCAHSLSAVQKVFDKFPDVRHLRLEIPLIQRKNLDYGDTAEIQKAISAKYGSKLQSLEIINSTISNGMGWLQGFSSLKVFHKEDMNATDALSRLGVEVSPKLYGMEDSVVARLQRFHTPRVAFDVFTRTVRMSGAAPYHAVSLQLVKVLAFQPTHLVLEDATFDVLKGIASRWASTELESLTFQHCPDYVTESVLDVLAGATALQELNMLDMPNSCLSRTIETLCCSGAAASMTTLVFHASSRFDPAAPPPMVSMEHLALFVSLRTFILEVKLLPHKHDKLPTHFDDLIAFMVHHDKIQTLTLPFEILKDRTLYLSAASLRIVSQFPVWKSIWDRIEWVCYGNECAAFLPRLLHKFSLNLISSSGYAPLLPSAAASVLYKQLAKQPLQVRSFSAQEFPPVETVTLLLRNWRHIVALTGGSSRAQINDRDGSCALDIAPDTSEAALLFLQTVMRRTRVTLRSLDLSSSSAALLTTALPFLRDCKSLDTLSVQTDVLTAELLQYVEELHALKRLSLSFTDQMPSSMDSQRSLLSKLKGIIRARPYLLKFTLKSQYFSAKDFKICERWRLTIDIIKI